MDLWIRSQDGKKISKINEDLIVVGNTIKKLYNDETSFMDLATYAKEERALEVLDEIKVADQMLVLGNNQNWDKNIQERYRR